MSRLRTLILALALALGLTLAITAAPASASGPVRQGDPAGYYMNFWGGNDALSAYRGVAANDAISIQSLPGTGNFQLRDNLHGGCVGDNGGGSGASRAGGALDCNSTLTGGGGGYGTRMERIASALCPAGYYLYWDYHWLAYVGYANSNGSAISLNTSGTCLKQFS